MEGEPAVHMLTQCTPLLVMRDVWKVSLLYTCLHSVHLLLVMKDVQKASQQYTCLHSVHPYW